MCFVIAIVDLPSTILRHINYRISLGDITEDDLLDFLRKIEPRRHGDGIGVLDADNLRTNTGVDTC